MIADDSRHIMDNKRRIYLESLADDYGVDLETVLMLADLLGPSEDYDGLITALKDHSHDL